MFNRHGQAAVKPTPSRPTFAELYCAQNGCAPQGFNRKIFWRTLHWRAAPLAPMLLLGDYFSSDHGLIDACGRATCMKQIYEEIDDHRCLPQNRGWLRRFAHFRVSTRRVRQLAERYLAHRTHPREPQKVAAIPITAGKPGTNLPRDAQPIFRAAAIRSLPPSIQITQLVREGFLKPLRPSFQP